MSVATHLGIDLAEYDARIRSFIPNYEEMLAVAAAAVPARARTIVDLGIGTGALAQACVRVAPRARVVGIDADAEILKVAAGRLAGRATCVCSSFAEAEIPQCDAVVASLALHHIRTKAAKRSFFRRIAKSLRRGGVLISVDCYPAAKRELAARQHRAWKAHMERTYTPQRAQSLLRAWSHEDFYMPLDTEMDLIRRAGLKPEVLWRKGEFAVIVAEK
ncbi:MAG TPA: class I SAM-dependent methyltransferase [Terriglobales bacterium]|nr:class I SAM-dependent methyltransferase [Terriglobales bacterium]